jgi:Tetratricopeptide repeat.
MKPENAETWYWKGNVLLELGEKEKALNAFRMLLESDPDHLNSLLSGRGFALRICRIRRGFQVLCTSPETQPGE